MRRSWILSAWRVGIAATALCGAVWVAAPAAASVPMVINIGNGAEPQDLDPHITTGVPEHHIIQNLFEALVSKDPKTLKPIPGVAESWKVSKDGKTYTFKLRKNAKWSNGESVTAKDFVYSWTRLLDPKTAAEYAYQAHYVKNGKAFTEGKITDPAQLGIKAVDPVTLVVELENPTPFFLGLLYHHSLYPVHQATIEKHGAKWTRPENMVSNGAFVLEKWEMNKIISLKKNPHYWDIAKVALDGANFHPIAKQDTEEKMFRAKELHVTETIPLEKIPTWRKEGGQQFQQHPYLGIYHYWVNVTKAPLDNKLVRKALALGFDRERIVTYVTRGGQLPAQAFTPPGAGGYTPPVVLPKDGGRIAEAKELLKKAGYPDGKGLPPIEILYNTSDAHKKIAEALQQMWKQNLGIDVRLVNQEWKVYLDSQRSKSYQLSRAGWIADYNDPNTFLDMFMSDNGNNRSGWSNKKFDELIVKAGKESNARKRLEYFRQAEAIVLDEQPTIPIYVYTRVFLKSPDVVGWHNNIEDIHPLKYVSLSPKP